MPAPVHCGQQKCKAYFLSVREFAHLNGERWTQGFRSRLGLRAGKLYRDLYGKTAKLKRDHSTARNMVRKFPCGMLELALRQLKTEEAAAAPASPDSLAQSVAQA
jgi:hypothetical protein